MINNLKRWLRGDADWKAEQKLNQLEQEDAFLSDAMDGYRSMPEGDHARTVDDLKGKLKKTYASEGSSMSWKTVAASVAAVVLTISVFVWTQRDVNGLDTIAEVTAPGKNQIEEKSRVATIEKDISEDISAISKEANGNSEKENIEESEPEPTIAFNAKPESNKRLKVDPSNIEAGIINEEDLVAEDAFVYADDENKGYNLDSVDNSAAGELVDNIDVVNESTYANNVPPSPTNDSIDEVTVRGSRSKAKDYYIKEEKASEAIVDNANRDEEKPSAASAKKVPNAIDQINNSDVVLSLKGKVMDAISEEPMIGVNVYIKNSADGTVTDLDGNFMLNSNQELPWSLVASSIGYLDQEFAISSLDDDFVIRMEGSGVALEEVAVTGYSKSRKNKADKNAIKTPKPRIGFRKMKRYIRKNMEYPKVAKQNKIQGGVTVRFFIDAEGKPEELKIINSIGSGCDKEAMRLLEEGPKWEPTGVWAIYTVVFSL